MVSWALALGVLDNWTSGGGWLSDGRARDGGGRASNEVGGSSRASGG